MLMGSANPRLGAAICNHLGIDPVQSEAITFSEGNTFVRVLENIRGQDVFLIQGVCWPVNDNFMELLFWVDALRLASAGRINVIMPHFSYAKGDKKDEPRVSIRARVCFDALEQAGADRIVTLDLHSPQQQGFCRLPVDHLYARHILCDYITSLKIPDLVVASADVGFGKNAFKYANILGTPVVIGNKMRTDHSETATMWNVVGDVRGKNVMIVDDIVFTGGSLIAMADAVLQLGAKSVYAAVTHGVLTPGAAGKIGASPIRKLIVTDTIEYRFEDPPANLEVVSVAELLARAIESIHGNGSLAALFPE